MISYRNYIAAVMLMIVLMFLLVGSNAMRDYWNDFAHNDHVNDPVRYNTTENPIWYDEAGHSTTGSVVFLGNNAGTRYRVAEQWAAYSRRDFAAFSTVQTYEASLQDGHQSDMLIIDTSSVDWTSNADMHFLNECVQQGVHLIFCSLPDPEVIRNSSVLRTLLGIRQVVEEHCRMDGLFLYKGFLLGGEKLYLRTEENSGETAMECVFPGDTDAAGNPVCDWYRLGSGTKVYMSGVLTDETGEPTEYPPLIWRNSIDSAYVFAVNGGYLNDLAEIGLLSAMASETAPFSVYPAVDAQNLILVNYPVLADENQDEMQRLYSMPALDVYQQLVWSNIQRVIYEHGYRISCMMTPQLDYSDDNAPVARLLEYYLRIFNEESAEAGLSLTGRPETSVEEKVEEDQLFFSQASDYTFTSVYSGDLQEKVVSEALESQLLSSVATVVKNYNCQDKLLSLTENNVTWQAAVDTEFTCTFRQDFQTRCMGTALGYTSLSYNMGNVAFPRGENDAWEKLALKFDASVYDYAQIFPSFEKTTVSEASSRIYSLLTTKYTIDQAEDAIRIRTEGADGVKRFILRTHNDVVKEIDGGSFIEIEEGAYLIQADREEIMVHLTVNAGNMHTAS